MVNVCLASILPIGCLTLHCSSLPSLMQVAPAKSHTATVMQAWGNVRHQALRPPVSYFNSPRCLCPTHTAPLCFLTCTTQLTLIQSPLLPIIHVYLPSSFPYFKTLLFPSNLRCFVFVFVFPFFLKRKKRVG